VSFLWLLPAQAAAFAQVPDTSGIEVSADGNTARQTQGALALDAFRRAQVGSNRELDGSYFGYLYYVADAPGYLQLIVVNQTAVVYVPADQAAAVGFDTGQEADRESLTQLLCALDGPASKGAAQLADVRTWHFTEEPTFNLDGARIRFDQELRPGEFYLCLIGEDGSDATDPANSDPLKPLFADFALLAKADGVTVEAPKEGLEAFISFLGEVDLSPLWVTLKTTGTAILFIFVLGLAAAYLSLRLPSRAQDVLDSIFTIPMVLPPTVCGFLLLLALGRNSAPGQWFIDIGFPLIFSWQATVIAAVVVAFPLMYRSARGAFEGLDADMLDAARTLGWSNLKIFFRLMLPLSWSSIAAGTVLAFARALGEFGATLFLAGNYVGLTRTIPIAIYFEWMNGRSDVALFWTVIIIIISFIVILFINLWGRRTTKYRRRIEE
jgi:molybdate transport system permease protein